MTDRSAPARYRFGDAARVGVLLGLSLRQTVPLVAGVVWLTLCLVAQQPLVGVVGLVVGVGGGVRAVAAGPAVRGRRPRRPAGVAPDRCGRGPWVRASLLGAGPGCDDRAPAGAGRARAARGRASTGRRSAVDGGGGAGPSRPGRCRSCVPVQGAGFPVASPREQDGLLAGWGAALAPLARARCPVARVTWQEWTHPVGVDRPPRVPRRRSTGRSRTPATVGLRRAARRAGAGHDRPRRARHGDRRPAPGPRPPRHVAAGCGDRRARRRDPPAGGAAGVGRAARSDRPLSPLELSTAIRLRSDPSRGQQRRLAAPLAGRRRRAGGTGVGADGGRGRTGSTPGSTASCHRSYRIAAWPMLPVAADWLAPLLTGRRRDPHGDGRAGTGAARPARPQDANRQLTSIEADHAPEGTSRVPAHRPRTAPPGRRRRPRARARRGPPRVPPRRHRHRHRRRPRRARRRLPPGSSRPPPSRCSTCARSPPARPRAGWRRSRSAAPSGRELAVTRHRDAPPAAPIGRRPPPRQATTVASRDAPRAASDRPSELGGGPGVPVEWQRSTMAHLCSVYPFHADAGFGERGVLIGANVTGGIRRVLLRPVRVLRPGPPDEPEHDRDGLGRVRQVGHRQGAHPPPEGRVRRRPLPGRSSTRRASTARSPPTSAWPSSSSHPGGSSTGSTRWTPAAATATTSVIARQTLAAQLVAGVLGRDLSPLEDAVLGWAVEQRCRSRAAVHAARPVRRDPRPARRARAPVPPHPARARPGHRAGHVRARQAVHPHPARHVRRPHHRRRRLGPRPGRGASTCRPSTRTATRSRS